MEATSDVIGKQQSAVADEKVQQKKRLSRQEQKARRKRAKHHPHSEVVAAPPSPAAKQEDLLASYEPIPISDSIHPQGASLGKWFPKAKVIKSSVTYSNDNKDSNVKASLVLFYQYVSPPWPESKVWQLLAYLAKVAETRKTLGGRIRVSSEGVNATVSSVDSGDLSARATLQYFCQDLKQFDKVFEETDFKFIDDQPPDRHFKDLKLLPVKELVFYGFREDEAPLERGGTHVEPSEFHSLLEEDSQDTVVVDVRNHYEAAIGRFDGGQAEYIDPQMRKSTDFSSWLSKPETQDKLKDKKVLMYCTGGVRCERASAFVNTQMGSKVKGVYQLKGGIERYLQEFPDGGYWRGKNFVFDKREAISADNRQGDGGVVKKSRKSYAAETHCCLCNTPWDRYIGKQKCHMCGVPVLVCDACLSCQKSKQQVTRCPLCVKQDISVPATEVEYTRNGVAAIICPQVGGNNHVKKAAPSVLKWGGGHASQKKAKRHWMRKPCQYGADCIRQDCFFLHPERKTHKTAAAAAAAVCAKKK